MNENESEEKQKSEVIEAIIRQAGGDPTSYKGQLIGQIIETALRLMDENDDLGQIKVVARSIKEMRYAYDIFNRYKDAPCISIFGSARTPEGHPDYLAAIALSSAMAKEGWMCITGAANGIMKAGLEGTQKEQSFGLSIRLPFETTTHKLIDGDPKLIFFRFFFTRKLMFMSHSNALAAFPGGYGTLDELFEMLTLIQTGKANIIPIVLLEGAQGDYWQQWRRYIQDNLLDNRLISPEDTHLYYLAPTVPDAVQHIMKFYSRYHSSRYVKDDFVIRMLTPLTEKQISQLNEQLASLIVDGKMTQSRALPEETDHLELPRLTFKHTRNDFGRLRLLIDAINDF